MEEYYDVSYQKGFYTIVLNDKAYTYESIEQMEAAFKEMGFDMEEINPDYEREEGAIYKFRLTSLR